MGFKDQPRDAHGRFLSPKRQLVNRPRIILKTPDHISVPKSIKPVVSHKPHNSQPRDSHGRFLSNKAKSPIVKSNEPNKTSGQLFPEIKGIFSRFF